MREPIRIVLVDEQPLFRAGCRATLEQADDFVVVGETATGEEGVTLAREHEPDVVLLDALLPSGDALQVARQIHRVSPRTAILVMTALEDEEQLFQALKLGAAAYLHKHVSAEELLAAIRQAHAGSYLINQRVLDRPSVAQRMLDEFRRLPVAESPRPAAQGAAEPLYSPLSSRETEILQEISRGQSNKEIAKLLAISDQTVKNHITSILKKLAVNDRTAAVVHALKHGWIALDTDTANGADGTTAQSTSPRV